MGIVLGPKDPEEDRQTDLSAAQAGELDDEHDHDPAVPPPGAPPRTLRLGAVVQVVSAPHPPSRAPEEGVVYGQTDRSARRHEHRHPEVQQAQPQIVGIPAPVGEEVVRAAVMPLPGQPRGLQHPGDRAVADAAEKPDRQHAEGPVRRRSEARSEQGQQRSERTGNLRHGGDPPVGRPRER